MKGDVFPVSCSLIVCAVALLSGCPPPQPDGESVTTTTISVVVSSNAPIAFLELAREQPLTPAEAALLHIIDCGYYSRDECLDAAKALAEIEKARIALDQTRVLTRRHSEVSQR
jgi:hypothetical protein